MGWSALFALAYRTVRRSTWATAIVVGLLVFSHWVLDVVAHRPDLPITIGGTTRVGLGLWNSVPATIIVESLLFIGGLVIYAMYTTPRDRVGSFALGGLVLFLGVVNVANILGPPPPSPSAVAWTAQAMWLLVAWGFWVDRHRRPSF